MSSVLSHLNGWCYQDDPGPYIPKRRRPQPYASLSSPVSNGNYKFTSALWTYGCTRFMIVQEATDNLLWYFVFEYSTALRDATTTTIQKAVVWGDVHTV